MKLPFFRNQSSEDEDFAVFVDPTLDDPNDDWFVWDNSVDTAMDVTVPSVDVMRKAAFGRIGLVTIEERSQLPALLTEVTQSALMQRILLPRNPRIATNELYELDSMDYIIMLSDAETKISRDMMRWLRRLKPMQIPIIVLLPHAALNRRKQQRLAQFEQKMGVPIIAVGSEDIEQAREQFLVTTMELMPAMGLALAAHLPTFRQPLMDNLLKHASDDSLSTTDAETVQWHLVRQMCAAHGIHEAQFEERRVAIETLMTAVTHYSESFVKRLPLRDDARRTRLTQAVSTLFIGHAVAVYLGSPPPSLRKQLIPQLWRLYRASRQLTAT